MKRLHFATGLFSLIACSSGHDLAPVFDNGEWGDDSTGSGGNGLGGETPIGDGDGDGSGGRPPLALGGASTGPPPPEVEVAECPAASEFSGAHSVGAINTDADEQLLALTPDELSVVFLREGALFVSDRSDLEAPFDAEALVALPDGFEPSLGVALTPSGLSLVLSHAEGRGFFSLHRSQKNLPFEGEPDDEMFFSINRITTVTTFTLSHPVLTAAGTQFWWVSTSAEKTSVWYSELMGSTFPWGVEVGCNEFACDSLLDGPADSGTLLTSVSEDLLTVFFTDENDESKMRWRDYVAVDAGFYDEDDLGDRFLVRVNEDCSRLFYTEGGDILFDER